MAFYSGFGGERAERTWASRMRILAQLGFTDVKEGPNGPLSYVLIWNPYTVVKELREQRRVSDKAFNALRERIIEIRAADFQQAAEPAGAAAISEAAAQEFAVETVS